MTKQLRIDFVSDVSCPWCAVGLKSLEQALLTLGDDVRVDLHFQPFELNPNMPPEGQDIVEHVTEKYGASLEQQASSREMIRERGAAVGFTFDMERRGRIYNTFDAHRLLSWAEEEVSTARSKHGANNAPLIPSQASPHTAFSRRREGKVRQSRAACAAFLPRRYHGRQ